MSKSIVFAKFKTARISPKKVKPVIDLVRGKDAKQAKLILAFDPTKGAKLALKVLRSAIANATNNLQIPESKLYVSEIRVDTGASLKRGRIVARGRSAPIIKRTSHLLVGLAEKEDK